MTWLYDFGDNWAHDVTLERALERDAGVDYPLVAAGRQACPPEDCGGPPGYADMLATLRNRGHPQHGELLAWLGEFDPDAFDVGLATAHAHATLRTTA